MNAQTELRAEKAQAFKLRMQELIYVQKRIKNSRNRSSNHEFKNWTTPKQTWKQKHGVMNWTMTRKTLKSSEHGEQELNEVQKKEKNT